MRVLVTGGGSDIGGAIIRRRLALGDEVIFTGSSSESLERTRAALDGAASGVCFRLEDPAAHAAEIDAVLARGIDAVVLNAATFMSELKRFHEHPLEAYTAYLDANIAGNCWLLHRVLPGMVARGFGRLVFVSSLAAEWGNSRYSGYCTSKAALEGLFMNLAVDYGRFDVLANVVRPGLIETRSTARFRARGGYAEAFSRVIPQGRLGQPTSVAEAIDPLLSRTSYMNGSIVTVSGGFPKMRWGFLKPDG